MRAVRPLDLIQLAGALLACGVVAGCSTLGFYEDTKVAIAITLDPKAPDPVEVTAAFKEAVFAMVPPREIPDTGAGAEGERVLHADGGKLRLRPPGASLHLQDAPVRRA